MSALQMFWSIAITSYTLWYTRSTSPVRPWTTWADVHSDFLRVDQYFSAFMPPFILSTLNVMWWFIPASTWIFVAFFSFGKEATDEYKKCFSWLKTNVLRRPDLSKAKSSFKSLTLTSNKCVLYLYMHGLLYQTFVQERTCPPNLCSNPHLLITRRHFHHDVHPRIQRAPKSYLDVYQQIRFLRIWHTH